MTMHTTGPFRAEVPPSSSGFGRAIYAVRDDAPDVFVAYVGNWKQNPAVEIADASLFVAAPDMLAALRVSESFMSGFEGDELQEGMSGMLAAIRAAIGKADGQEEPPATKWGALTAWAKTLTDDHLSATLNEMRDRGAAVAIYDPGEIRTMFDGMEFVVEPEDWLDEENRAHVEESMCEAARAIFERELRPGDVGNDECEQGIHSWADEVGMLAPDTRCKHCGEIYGELACEADDGFDCDRAFTEGWGIFQASGDGQWFIDADDEAPSKMFIGDAACEYVEYRAAQGSEYHRDALEWVAEANGEA